VLQCLPPDNRQFLFFAFSAGSYRFTIKLCMNEWFSFVFHTFSTFQIFFIDCFD
jgi:hypothetical protein